MSAKTATTKQVAGKIGADPDELRKFVEYHPDPTPAIILGAWAADPSYTDLVEEWLEAFESKRARRRPERFEEVGPA